MKNKPQRKPRSRHDFEAAGSRFVGALVSIIAIEEVLRSTNNFDAQAKHKYVNAMGKW